MVDLQFWYVVSDTFNEGSVQSVKELVPDAITKAKQKVIGEVS